MNLSIDGTSPNLRKRLAHREKMKKKTSPQKSTIDSFLLRLDIYVSHIIC